MYKLKKILHSTTTKIVSIVLLLAFLGSVFLYFDFYKRQINKIRGYYWVYQGDRAYKKLDLQKAVNCYEHAIKLHPKHYRAMYNLANIYVVYEDYYSALKNYEKALEIKPEFEVARIDYAIILSQTYEIDRAIEEYQKVIENKPGFIKIPFLVDSKKSYKHNRGVAYYNMGLAYRTKSMMAGLNSTIKRAYLKKASSSYEKATEILNSYNSNYNLGLIHQLLKNPMQAGYYYCKAMELSPLEYESHFNLAVLLNDMKEYEGASSEFKKAGLLLDSIGDNTKTTYIYNVLSNVNQKIAINATNDYYKKIKEKEEEASSRQKYKAGKLVLDDSSDEELIENFSICANKELFMGDI